MRLSSIIAACVGTLAALAPSTIAKNSTKKLKLESSLNANVREYYFKLSNDYASPDGFERPVMFVNDQFPGPLIEAYTGDTIRVHVSNQMNESTSVHFHGIFQRGTPWMDGVPAQTQCPIPVGGEFTYEFQVPDQWGTYWYHSHHLAQYVDGIVGPLIIHNPDKEPYKNLYDEEYTVMLTDWYHKNKSSLVPDLLSPQGDLPIPDNGLINGHNSYNCSNAPVGSQCVLGAPLSAFKFETGKRYRLRIINTSSLSAFNFSIDGHQMTVIEADATDVEQLNVSSITINVAQRYSVIVEANQPFGSYYMRAELVTSCYPVPAPNLDPLVKAIINYDNSSIPPSEVLSVLDSCPDLDPTLLKPYEALDAPDPVDKNFTVEMLFKADNKSINRAYVNGVTYVPDYENPILLEAWRGAGSFNTSANVEIIPSRGVVQFVLNNFDLGEHPFHLHGHEFFVLGSGPNAPYNPNNASHVINLKNPIRRDTSTVPGMGWTVLRFVADNPGVWAFHCHIEWHVVQGLVIQFLELPDEVKKLDIPSQVLNLCNVNNLNETVHP